MSGEKSINSLKASLLRSSPIVYDHPICIASIIYDEMSLLCLKKKIKGKHCRHYLHPYIRCRLKHKEV